MSHRSLPAAAAALLLAGLGCWAPAAKAGTLDVIKARGTLRCGVNPELPGLSVIGSDGQWHGFHVDVCRATAAAVLGDADKVSFVPLSLQTRFTALQSAEIDLLEAPTALTLTRDVSIGLSISVVTMYTGQGVLVNKRVGVSNVRELNGATICAIQGSEIERNLSDYAKQNAITLNTLAFEGTTTMLGALSSGRCDAVSNDIFSLAGYQEGLPDKDSFRVLPDIVAKEPQGIMVRADDLQWATITRWIVFALIQAEESGVTQANVAELARSNSDEKVRRFLGGETGNGRSYGLDKGWPVKVIAAVGNYGEIYDRSLGSDGLHLERGFNRLWSNGGMLMSWLWQ